MSEQTLPAVVEKAQPVPMARIECGCGFSAEGFDESCNVSAFDSHTCFQESYSKEHSWHESVFDFLTVAALVVGVVLVVAVLSGEVPW